MPKRGKNYQQAVQNIDRETRYALEEAIGKVKEASYVKFDASIDAAINLGVDPRHADQMIRGAVVLPHGTGKSVRVLVFAEGDKAKEAEEAGADFVGSKDLADKIKGGWLDFDKAVAVPAMMRVVGPLGRVLGPRGLMPNPKVGTVTMDVKAAVEAAKGGEVQFKAEKGGVVHAGVGKASFDEAKLVENVRAFVSAVRSRIIPAPTVTFVSFSMTMKPPVVLFLA